MDVAIGVRRSTPIKLDDAVSEAIRLNCINQAFKRSRPIGVHAIQHPNNHGNHSTPPSSEMQQVLKGIEDLKASQEHNFSSIRGQLENHEERLRLIESGSVVRSGKKQAHQMNCFRYGKPGHIARNCRSGTVQGCKHGQSGDNNSSYSGKRGRHQESKILTIPGMNIPGTNSNSCFLSGYLSNHPVSFLLGTGANVSVIRRDVWKAAGGDVTATSPWVGRDKLVSASGERLHVVGTDVLYVRLGTEVFQQPFIVVMDLPMKVLLGADFIKCNHCILDLANNEYIFMDRKVKFQLEKKR